MIQAWFDFTLRWMRILLFDPSYYWHFAALIILGDALLIQLIIRFVPYTEIDWETYMHHVKLYLDGERDYTAITGETGPLVYPAGHLYIHQLLYSITSSGLNIARAQQIYGVLYTLSLSISCILYRISGEIPNWIILLLPLSRRLHSLYVLRLFNDCWAVALIQCAILAFTQNLDTLGCIIFSLALSVKMSILLYLPGVLLILWKRRGLVSTFLHILAIIFLQLLLGLPFISHYPLQYFSRSFEFSRVFLYKWTVNWRFIDEKTFLSRELAVALLIGHFSTLAAFAIFKWTRKDGGFVSSIRRGFIRPNDGTALQPVSADQITTILTTCNIIGIVFARSLHYQFYSWYTHQIPFLTCRTRFPVFVKIALILAIEYCWNVVPYSTNFSSLLLLSANAAIIAGVWTGWPEGRN